MSAAIVFVQLGAVVLLSGYALFRVVMSRASARADGPSPGAVEAGLASFRWPSTGDGLSLPALGWIFIGAVLALQALRLVLGAPTAGAPGSLALGALLVAAHQVFLSRTSAITAPGLLVVVLIAGVGLVAPRPAGGAYSLALGIHIAAAMLWLGHMFFWSVFSGPGLKRLPDRDAGIRLREASLAGPGLGWPALVALSLTGAYLLDARGIGVDTLLSTDFASQRFGLALDAKLVLVLVMVGYQAVFGHREAPRAILANMAVALLVLALAALLTGV